MLHRIRVTSTTGIDTDATVVDADTGAPVTDILIASLLFGAGDVRAELFRRRDGMAVSLPATLKSIDCVFEVAVPDGETKAA